MSNNELFSKLKRCVCEYSGASTLSSLITEHGVQALRVRGYGFQTILMYAAAQGDIECVEAILSHELCTAERLVELGYEDGNNALMLAACNGHDKCVEAILSHELCPPDILAQTRHDGCNALMLAASKGHANCIDVIFAHNVNVEEMLLTKNKEDGKTALIYAVEGRKIRCVKYIVASTHCTAEVLNAKDNDNNTALSIAAAYHDDECFTAILSGKHCTPQVIKQNGVRAKAASRCSHILSYQKIVQGIESWEQQVIALLSDYCKGSNAISSRLSLFAHGHVNRHHTKLVRRILRDYHDKVLLIGDVWYELTNSEMVNDMNYSGSLCRRLQFLHTRVSPEGFDYIEEESSSSYESDL